MRQFRSNWDVNAATGKYKANIPSPTGIASDPALSSYGTQQADQLGEHLLHVQPPVDLIYSSPFYRCLQTLSPFVNKLIAQQNGKQKVHVHVEPGLGEFYGLARFDHPQPATIEVLNQHFPHLHAEKEPIIVPSTKGESLPQLHDRIAYCLQKIIEKADADPSKPKALLICTHAAAMISIARALTGLMPDDPHEDDFQCFTCSFSKFTRRQKELEGLATARDDAVDDKQTRWDPNNANEVPDVHWRGGKGVAGGWDCEINADCSFLEGGEERGW